MRYGTRLYMAVFIPNGQTDPSVWTEGPKLLDDSNGAVTFRLKTVDFSRNGSRKIGITYHMASKLDKNGTIGKLKSSYSYMV